MRPRRFGCLPPATGEDVMAAKTETILNRKRLARAYVSRLSQSAQPCASARNTAGKSARHLCGYIDIIYSTTRKPHSRIAIDRPGSPFGLSLLPASRTRPSRTAAQPSTTRRHQKHINWSQIMQESPQWGSFTGLPCTVCIGDILLCLFLF